MKKSIALLVLILIGGTVFAQNDTLTYHLSGAPSLVVATVDESTKHYLLFDKNGKETYSVTDQQGFVSLHVTFEVNEDGSVAWIQQRNQMEGSNFWKTYKTTLTDDNQLKQLDVFVMPEEYASEVSNYSMTWSTEKEKWVVMQLSE